MDDLPYEPVDRDRQAERARAEKLPGYTEARELTPEIADTLRAREQLMEDINSIIESNFGLVEYKDDVIKQLRDAVYKNFPITPD